MAIIYESSDLFADPTIKREASEERERLAETIKSFLLELNGIKSTDIELKSDRRSCNIQFTIPGGIRGTLQVWSETNLVLSYFVTGLRGAYPEIAIFRNLTETQDFLYKVIKISRRYGIPNSDADQY